MTRHIYRMTQDLKAVENYRISNKILIVKVYKIAELHRGILFRKTKFTSLNG